MLFGDGSGTARGPPRPRAEREHRDDAGRGSRGALLVFPRFEKGLLLPPLSVMRKHTGAESFATEVLDGGDWLPAPGSRVARDAQRVFRGKSRSLPGAVRCSSRASTSSLRLSLIRAGPVGWSLGLQSYCGV